MNLNFKSEHSIPQTTQSSSFLTCIWLIQGLIDAACEVKFLPMWGNPRQSWIVDSTGWIPDSRYSFPVFVSRTWILDSDRQCDSGFLELYSGFQFLDFGLHKQNFPGFRSPQAPYIGRKIASGKSKKGVVLICVLIQFYPWLNILFYYIDMSVLMENIPLVKFIKTTSGTEWFIFHNLTSEFIDDAISVISLQNL